MIQNLNKSGLLSNGLEYQQLTYHGDPIDAYSVTLHVLVEDLSDDMINCHAFLTYDQALDNYSIAKELGVNLSYGHINVFVSELSMPELYNKIRQDVLSSSIDR